MHHARGASCSHRMCGTLPVCVACQLSLYTAWRNTTRCQLWLLHLLPSIPSAGTNVTVVAVLVSLGCCFGCTRIYIPGSSSFITQTHPCIHKYAYIMWDALLTGDLEYVFLLVFLLVESFLLLAMILTILLIFFQ